ncbi:PIN domain-containing protein [Candidatus Leptofilum sp.]|uniref:PIN domain-containing protein n=1 Tax=Candidatus Leptofilum sp. TaxID=3241576 RepID=UPI003B5B01D7
MANKPTILVDLNVIVDVIQQRQPFYEESARVVDTVVRGQAAGWLAAHSFTTLFYVINRVRNRETAVTAITGLLEAFSVAAVDDQVIRQALAWGWPDFEDAVQMAAAVNAKADYLITRNPRDFKVGILPVIQPAAFLTLLDL